MPASAKEPLIETLPLEERIRRRAFELYVARGRQSGSPLADWLEAEASRLDANGIEPNEFARRIRFLAATVCDPSTDFAELTATARHLADEAEAESHRSFDEPGEMDGR